MLPEKGITRELSLGEVVSKTFDLYRRDFVKYTILFLVVEAIVGILTTLVNHAVILPKTPIAGSTTQDYMNWLPGFFGALIALIALTAIISWVFYPISLGSAVKIASDDIVTGQADLAASVRFSVSRIVWIWIVGIVVGIIVTIGYIALVIPGIILTIMFALVLPALLIQKPGFESMSRSRKLVSDRWLKTLALIIVFGIIIGIASAIASVIAGVFGVASTFVGSILSAFYLPLIPIVLTVYYYSNAARVAPPQMPQMPAAPGSVSFLGETRYCPTAGRRLPRIRCSVQVAARSSAEFFLPQTHTPLCSWGISHTHDC